MSHRRLMDLSTIEKRRAASLRLSLAGKQLRDSLNARKDADSSVTVSSLKELSGLRWDSISAFLRGKGMITSLLAVQELCRFADLPTSVAEVIAGAVAELPINYTVVSCFSTETIALAYDLQAALLRMGSNTRKNQFINMFSSDLRSIITDVMHWNQDGLRRVDEDRELLERIRFALAMIAVRSSGQSQELQPVIHVKPEEPQVLPTGETTSDSVRFVLTARSFQQLEGEFGADVVQLVKQQLELTRAMLNMLVQIKDDYVRQRIRRALRREVEQTELAIRQFSEVYPTGIQRMLDGQTQFFVDWAAEDRASGEEDDDTHKPRRATPKQGKPEKGKLKK